MKVHGISGQIDFVVYNTYEEPVCYPFSWITPFAACAQATTLPRLSLISPSLRVVHRFRSSTHSAFRVIFSPAVKNDKA
jgi:hypothetical protein